MTKPWMYPGDMVTCNLSPYVGKLMLVIQVGPVLMLSNEFFFKCMAPNGVIVADHEKVSRGGSHYWSKVML